MSYTEIDDPTLYFVTTLYVGNNNNRTITLDGTGMQPDLIWNRARPVTNDHALVDSVRGAGKLVISNTDGAEITNNNVVTSITSGGFSVTGNGGWLY